LQRLSDHNLQRGGGRHEGADRKVAIKLLYPVQLTEVAGKDEEHVAVPEPVTNVQTLLAWLRKRREGRETAIQMTRFKSP